MNAGQRPEVVVITGASAGVGRATACAFARRGAHIGLLARGREGLEGARAEVEKLGGKAMVVPADVAYPDQVEAAADAVEQEFGPIDIWVNNAMTTVYAPVMDLRPEEVKRVTEVIYLGTVHGTQAALKRMRRRNHGTIVQVGSALAYRSIPLQAAYCAGKAAIRAFTDSLRTELLHDKSGIKLTMVQMPALNTPQFNWCRSHLDYHPQPVPPIFQPEVAAEAIVYAAHHPRREMFVGGSSVQAIWGNKLIPGLLDRYMARKAYRAQQTSQPTSPNRPDNLWSPVPGDPGAHGSFDSAAHRRSLQLAASEHRAQLTAAGAVTGAVLGTVMWLLRRRANHKTSARGMLRTMGTARRAQKLQRRGRHFLYRYVGHK